MISETYRENPLVLGGFPTFAEPETIAAGQGLLVKGTALGRVATSGKWVKAAKAAADGSQLVRGILAEDLDTTAADQVGPVFKTGLFNPDAMSFGTGHTVETVHADLVGTPLFLRRPLADG